MPCEIEWQMPNGVIKRHFGHVTGRELLSAVIETEADHRFDSLRYVINDFRDCTGLTVSQDDIVEIAAIDHAAAVTNPNIRIAVVGNHPDVVAAATAYANDPLTAFTLRLFGSMDEAQSWLGLVAA